MFTPEFHRHIYWKLDRGYLYGSWNGISASTRGCGTPRYPVQTRRREEQLDQAKRGGREAFCLESGIESQLRSGSRSFFSSHPKNHSSRGTAASSGCLPTNPRLLLLEPRAAPGPRPEKCTFRNDRANSRKDDVGGGCRTSQIGNTLLRHRFWAASSASSRGIDDTSPPPLLLARVSRRISPTTRATHRDLLKGGRMATKAR